MTVPPHARGPADASGPDVTDIAGCGVGEPAVSVHRATFRQPHRKALLVPSMSSLVSTMIWPGGMAPRSLASARGSDGGVGDVVGKGVDLLISLCVTFEELSEVSTRVTVTIDWQPDGLVEKAAGALGLDNVQVLVDLERFKEWVEGADGSDQALPLIRVVRQARRSAGSGGPHLLTDGGR